MKSRLLLLAALIPLILPNLSHAQETPTPPNQGRANLILWRCKLPGGAYDVSVRSIVSVSKHEYLVDAVARVTEVNIDTLGSVLVRFYYLEPALPETTAVPGGQSGTELIKKAEEKLGEAGKKVGLDHWKKVTKNYPTTTHARTVEFRLSKKEQLEQLFSSAQNSFRNQVAGNFSAQE
ncbi:MAG: hypothetical protein ACO1QR_15210 [Chthoniobacteraceae bacterium]